jgi:hypothetical protein
MLPASIVMIGSLAYVFTSSFSRHQCMAPVRGFAPRSVSHRRRSALIHSAMMTRAPASPLRQT